MLTKLCLMLGLLAVAQMPGRAGDKPTVRATTLTINGLAVDNNTVWLTSKGVLALVEGGAQSLTRKPVQFQVSLRRAGRVVNQWPAAKTEGIYSVQLEDLWRDARIGDELIVEPVDADKNQSAEQSGKRVIKLQGFNWMSHCMPVDKC